MAACDCHAQHPLPGNMVLQWMTSLRPGIGLGSDKRAVFTLSLSKGSWFDRLTMITLSLSKGEFVEGRQAHRDHPK